jgi:hypothetical protein
VSVCVCTFGGMDGEGWRGRGREGEGEGGRERVVDDGCRAPQGRSHRGCVCV